MALDPASDVAQNALRALRRSLPPDPEAALAQGLIDFQRVSGWINEYASTGRSVKQQAAVREYLRAEAAQLLNAQLP